MFEKNKQTKNKKKKQKHEFLRMLVGTLSTSVLKIFYQKKIQLELAREMSVHEKSFNVT